MLISLYTMIIDRWSLHAIDMVEMKIPVLNEAFGSKNALTVVKMFLMYDVMYSGRKNFRMMVMMLLYFDITDWRRFDEVVIVMMLFYYFLRAKGFSAGIVTFPVLRRTSIVDVGDWRAFHLSVIGCIGLGLYDVTGKCGTTCSGANRSANWGRSANRSTRCC
jgi:hypothetical protein